MGQIIDRASSPLFISNTQKKVEQILCGWTVDTVANAANVASAKYFRHRGNYSLAYKEFTTLPFLFLYGKPNNSAETEQNLMRVWSLFYDGGFQDEAVDQNGKSITPKSFDNVHVDGLQLFSSLLWLLPRRCDDRAKLNATFDIFDFSGAKSLSEFEVLMLLSSCLTGLHLFTEGFILLPHVDHLQIIIKSVFKNLATEQPELCNYKDYEGRINYRLFVNLYDELEQTSIDALILGEGIRKERDPEMKDSNKWQGTTETWMESFLFSSIDQKMFKTKWYDNPDPDVKYRKSLPPPPPTDMDISTWNDVLSVLKEDEFKDKLADLEASELDVSNKRYIKDREAELLTLYLSLNNYGSLHSVNISHCQLKGAGTELLVSGLVLNQTVRYLNCSDNDMGVEGAMALASYLATTNVLRVLKAGVNKFGGKGAEQIADVFIESRNQTLQSFDMRGNNLGRDGGIAMGKAIRGNPKSLTALNLSDNGIDAAASDAIGLGIEVNDVLFHLDLSKNRIYDDGAVAIFKGMLKNKSISSLRLGYNNIKARGAKAIARILQSNKTLTELSLSANKIGTKYYERPVKKPISTHLRPVATQMMPHVYSTEGTAAIVSAMEKNCVLSMLDLSMNHIDTECGKQIYETFVLNKASCLKYLSLSGNEISHELVKAFKKAEKFRRRQTRMRTERDSSQNAFDAIEKDGNFTDIPKIDISQQTRMRSVGSIPMQTPIRVWKETTDINVGEGALSTTSLGRSGMKLENERAMRAKNAASNGVGKK